MSSVRFKTGSQKKIQAVALNKTGTQCIYQCFPPEWEGVAGIPWGLDSQTFGNLTVDFGTRAAP